MRRRKSILPALIIESLALLALGGLYFSSHPLSAPANTEQEQPSVPFIADSLRAFSDLHTPQTAPATNPRNEQPPFAYEPPPFAHAPQFPTGNILHLR
jgi:hypothetical protein